MIKKNRDILNYIMHAENEDQGSKINLLLTVGKSFQSDVADVPAHHVNSTRLYRNTFDEILRKIRRSL